jgi:hypothetical protein
VLVGELMSAKDEAWKIEAERLYNEDSANWNYEKLGQRYGKKPGYIKKVLSVRRTNKPVDEPSQVEKLPDLVLKQLQKERSTNDICKQLKISERILTATLDDLRESGFVFVENNGLIKLCKSVIPSENVHEENWNGEKIIRFGVAGDKQMCSKYQQLTHLETMYDIFQREGITTVYDPGDLTEGCKMRPGQEHEIFKHGADEQEQYIVDFHPKRKGIVTKFILGNHDAAHIKNGGRDIGVGIAQKRPDMIYLGLYNAKVKLTPNCILELNHPWDGAAYALSYSLQKYIDSISGGEKPNVLLNGHHHKMMYLFYRNIHAFETGTFCAQTPFMRGKRIAAHVGGWIIEVHVDGEGTVTRCKGEFFPFYKMVENDY